MVKPDREDKWLRLDQVLGRERYIRRTLIQYFLCLAVDNGFETLPRGRSLVNKTIYKHFTRRMTNITTRSKVGNWMKWNASAGYMQSGGAVPFGSFKESLTNAE